MTLHLLRSGPEGRAFRLWMAQSTLALVGLLVLVSAASVSAPEFALDLSYDYVTARGLLEGVDISSVKVSDLAARYLPNDGRTASLADCCQYPNAHPPALLLANVPFALLPFPVVSWAWLALNMLALVVVGRWLGFSRQASLALVIWPPLWLLLLFGQYELLMLFLVMAGWRAAQKGRDYQAGVLIGLVAVMKLYPGLFVIPYLVRGRFRLFASTCLVFILGQALGALMLGGPIGLFHYYQRLGGIERSVILIMFGNSSPYAALGRLLEGVGGTPPLVYLPELVLPLTIGLSLLGLVGLIKLRPEAAPLAALVALPNSMFYCAVFALPQLVLLWHTRWRSSSLWRVSLVGTAAAISFVIALVTLVVVPVLRLLGIDDQPTRTVAAVFLAAEPIGYLTLLILSFIDESRPSKADRATHSPAPAAALRYAAPGCRVEGQWEG